MGNDLSASPDGQPNQKRKSSLLSCINGKPRNGKPAQKRQNNANIAATFMDIKMENIDSIIHNKSSLSPNKSTMISNEASALKSNDRNSRADLILLTAYPIPLLQSYQSNFVRIEFDEKENSRNHGTGFILRQTQNEYLVLTCLHNIKSRKKDDIFCITGQEKFKNWKVCLEKDQGRLGVEEDNIIEHPKMKDLALIQVQKYHLRAEPVKATDPSIFKKQNEICLFGYMKNAENVGTYEPLQGSTPSIAKLLEHEPTKIKYLSYKAASTNGFSGAPIIVIQGGSIRIVGVHTASEKDFGKGVAFTEQDIAWIQKNIQSLNNKSKRKSQINRLTSINYRSINFNDSSHKDIQKNQKYIKQCLISSNNKAVIISACGFNLKTSVITEFKKFQRLECLSLTNNLIDNAGLMSILINLPSITKLYLKDNPITFRVIETIPNEVKSSKLQILELGNLWVKEANHKMREIWLVRFVSHISSLSELEVGYDGGATEGVGAVHTQGCIRDSQNTASKLMADYKKWKEQEKVATYNFKLYEQSDSRKARLQKDNRQQALMNINRIDKQIYLLNLMSAKKEEKYINVQLNDAEGNADDYCGFHLLNLRMKVEYSRSLIKKLRAKCNESELYERKPCADEINKFCIR